MATKWYNPFDGDVIPGVNVGAGIRRITGKATEDEDIIHGISKKGGDRSNAGWMPVGRTVNPVSYPLNPTDNTKTIDELSNNVIYQQDNLVGGGGGVGGSVDRDAALRNTLRAEILARGGDIESVYASLFGELDNLVRSRDAELEGQYGNQFKKAADSYAGALPEIENSYAAIGAADSTDQTDAKGKAKTGYEETTRQIGENKASDKAKLGSYRKEQEAKISADRDAAQRNLARVNETDDVDALRGMRNDLESNISSAGVTRATLGSNGAARQELSNLTQDSGRFDAAINALDSIIKSSMSGSVKEAAVKAIADNSGLSDEEKKKVNAQYGNVYAEQAAL